MLTKAGPANTGSSRVIRSAAAAYRQSKTTPSLGPRRKELSG